ncbi:MAG: hypothetical protein HOG41_15480 [Gammaproteobacteria bacterium]|jgi:hypothetical protein|nr:hypothetical protein [Gammaproteobacteria bacterium]MBT4449309.1 hypothetical protein [Gammaproteobacteria bacterium]MBT4861153.1 hypothetical protein [Gammaproteobacteria bacterium]MBT6455913.1 hypothetical protein [Gammaproteobacteria bacterium]MBT7043874.1 hypothetical protein [Gammaproteobacteria bacterium]
MTSLKIRSSCFYSRIIDLIVLATSFLLLAVITGFGSFEQVIIDLVLYVAVVFISLRVCKRIVFEHIHTSRRITSVLLGNISGLLLGALSVILLDQLFPGIGESALIVILSSILAFFILGTLSPMVKSSYHDIIQH